MKKIYPNQPQDQAGDLLAQVYFLILSWPEPEYESETASPDDLDRDTDEAAETTPTRVEGAS